MGRPDLPAQHRQLVPQHDDLELLELSGSEQKIDERQNALEHDVAPWEHGTSQERRPSFYAIEFTHPSSSIWIDIRLHLPTRPDDSARPVFFDGAILRALPSHDVVDRLVPLVAVVR